MAVRNVRTDKDEILRKKSKNVEEINDKIKSILKDMAETMYKEDGVGLAAPQVGILKRLVVIDAGDGLLELINPVLVEQSGEQTCIEGCLSVTDVVGEVTRAEIVKVEALNTEGEKMVICGEGLLARAFAHEIDHLDGILFIDRATRIIKKEDLEEE